MGAVSKDNVSAKRYLKEMGYCVLAVLILELIFYLVTSDEFSIFVYFKSAAEVFAAPLHPGWRLGYPTLILIAVFALLFFLRNVERRALRVPLLFTLILGWVALGFATIIEYYR